MNSTIAGLNQIFKKAWRIILAIKKARWKALKNEISSKELIEIYMNARYNLRPLVYDAKAIYTIFAKNEEKGNRQTFRASATDQSSTSDDISDLLAFNLSGLITFRASAHRESHKSVKVRAGILTQSDRIYDAQLWGLDSIIETAWDLVPFSFVVDWFINLGTTLMAWTPQLGIKTLASWVTVEETLTQKVSINEVYCTKDGNGTTFQNARNESAAFGFSQKVTRTKTRTPNAQRSVIPRFDLNLDPLKIFDLGVIVQGFRKNASYVR